MPTASTLDPTLRRLSETEIQERLYGEYRGPRLKPSTPPPPPRPAATPTKTSAPAPVSTEPAWTGQEILSRELQRLSQELDQLRQEKGKLASELARRAKVSVEAVTAAEDLPQIRMHARTERAARPEGRAASVTVIERPASAEPEFSSAEPSGAQFWMMLGLLLILSASMAVGLSTMASEAQPPLLGSGSGGLYSVQVGVYDAKAPAQRFVDALCREGQPAFLVQGTTRRGAARYVAYVGRYPSKVEAQVQLDLLKHNPLLADSFVLQRQGMLAD